MRKILLGALLSVVLSACTIPSDYCDKVTGEVSATDEAMNEMTAAIKLHTSGSENSNLKKTYDEGYATIQESLKTLYGMSDFRGDDDLRKSAAEYVAFHASYYENELKFIVDILEKDSVTTEDVAVLKNYSSHLGQRRNDCEKKYKGSLIKFMNEYDLLKADY